VEKQPQPQSIDEALRWHAAIIVSVIEHRAAVLAALRGGTTAAGGAFIGSTEADIDAFFDAERAEVDGMCIVNIVAAAEAEIRRDYRERVRRNGADPLSLSYVAFKNSLSGQKVWRPDFDQGGILEALKASNAVAGHIVTSFRHALRIRHWYAHGRHWLLTTNVVDEPAAVYDMCNKLLLALPG
jgi:hypothetical protein